MRARWEVGEAAQADYEQLRTAVVAGTPLVGLAAARFERAGLWALIARPVSAPVFAATVVGATRPAWSPYADPRVVALGDGYELIVAVGTARGMDKEDTG